MRDAAKSCSQVLISYPQSHDEIVSRIADIVIIDRLKSDATHERVSEVASLLNEADHYYSQPRHSCLCWYIFCILQECQTTGRRNPITCCVPVSQFIPASIIGPLTKPQKS